MPTMAQRIFLRFPMIGFVPDRRFRPSPPVEMFDHPPAVGEALVGVFRRGNGRLNDVPERCRRD